ncbi:MAG: hypothetical protein KDB27_04685, partial [Planctomycetales bacterium]|nr:hypothetical protein [Planctomycetales bacterium]
VEYRLVVPESPAAAAGLTPDTTADGWSYVLLHAAGSATLPGYSLNGTFDLLVEPSRAVMTASGQLSVGTSSITIGTMNAAGALQINAAGLAGKLSVTATSGGSPFGSVFNVSGGVHLLINTTSQDVSIDLPATFNALTSFGVSTTDQTALNGVTGTNVVTVALHDQLTSLQSRAASPSPRFTLVVPDSVTPTATPASYAMVRSLGTASMPGVAMNGRFDLALVGSSFEMVVDATSTITVLGTLDVDGKLTVNSSGLYGNLQAVLQSNVSVAGFSLSAGFQFLFNTTNTNQTVNQFIIDNQTGSVSTSSTITRTLGPSSFIIMAGGTLSLHNSFAIRGQFQFTIDPSGLAIGLDARVGVFNQQLAIAGNGKIFSDGNIAFDVTATSPHFIAGTGSVTLFDIRAATARFQVNTGSTTQLGVSPNTALVSIANANINAMGFSVSGGISVGINNGYFEIVVPSSQKITLDFFVVNIGVHGWFKSKVSDPTDTTFSITGSASASVGTSTFGASGSFSVTVASTGFHASFSGSATLFGIDFASVTGNISLSGQSVTMSITVSVGIPGYCIGRSWWRVCTPSITVSKTASFTLGSTSPPDSPPPPPPVIATLLSNGVLRLNVGPNASIRGDSLTNENYEVRHISGTAGSETVEVTGVGYTKQYSGVAKIYAPDAGSGDDFLQIHNGVFALIEFHGGDGSDQVLHGGSGAATITGGNGLDVLVGGSGNDNINGNEGDDQISGGAGNDVLRGEGGADTISGNDGTDTIHGGSGDDFIDGQAGNDLLYGDDGSDRIQGGDGNDTIDGNAGNDSLMGDAGSDTIHGNAGSDTILGGADNDFLYGDEDDDVVIGDGGDDLIHGSTGNDTLLGDSGQHNGTEYVSTTSTDAGNDTIHGHAGNDTIRGGAGADALYGTENNDTIYGNQGDDQIWGGSGDDTLNGNEDQ